MPTDDWHYIRGDQQFGPVPFQILQDLARTGDVSAEDTTRLLGLQAPAKW